MELYHHRWFAEEAIKTLKGVYRLDYYPSIHPTIVKNEIAIMKISNILASIVKKLAEAKYGICHDVNRKLNTQACEIYSLNFMYDALYSDSAVVLKTIPLVFIQIMQSLVYIKDGIRYSRYRKSPLTGFTNHAPSKSHIICCD